MKPDSPVRWFDAERGYPALTAPRRIIMAVALSLAASLISSADEWKTLPDDTSPKQSDAQYLIYSASYALVIGIDAYDNGWPRLGNAIKDATEVAKVLEEIGFTVELATNLTSENFASTIKSFFVKRGSDDNARLLLWYAGHGHTIKGEGFLVPADAPLDSHPDFKLKALHMRDFGSYVRLAESKHALAIFDSCFSGTIFDSPRAAPPAAITWATARPVRQFLSSGDANQTVVDDGTFRKVFVDALRGKEPADANNDGYLTASELGLFMTDRILNLTRSRQTPRFGALRDRDWDQGDFVITVPSNIAVRSPDSGSIQTARLRPDGLTPGATPPRTKGLSIRLAQPQSPSGALGAVSTPPRPQPTVAAPPRERTMMELVQEARARQKVERADRLTDQALNAAEQASKKSSCQNTCADLFRNVTRERNWVSERQVCNSTAQGWDSCVEQVKKSFQKRLIEKCAKKC